MKDRNLKAQIYLNENTQNSLKNCQLSETKLLGDSYLIKCKFTQNDVKIIIMSLYFMMSYAEINKVPQQLFIN